jgi:hypothetical protein
VCCCGFAQVKPDFSGTWKLNNGKSTKDGPEDRVYLCTVTQSKNTITIATKAEGVTNRLDGTFTTDGKDHIEKVENFYRFTKVTWEGSTLVFEIAEKDSRKELAKILFYLRESWTLSPDKAVLTKFRRTAKDKAIVDQKYVFDKQ